MPQLGETVTEGTIYLAIDGETMESALTRLMGPDSNN